MQYEYQVSSPGLSIELEPPDGFADMYKRWFAHNPAIPKPDKDPSVERFFAHVPASVKLTMSIHLKLTLVPENETVIDDDFPFVVLAYLATTEDHRVQLVPIKAYTPMPPSELNELLSKRISSLKTKARETSNDCRPLHDLIAHLINVLLAQNISSFVFDLPIPQAIPLFDGVELNNIKPVVLQKHLIVVADAVPTKSFQPFSATGLSYKPSNVPRDNFFLLMREKFFKLLAKAVMNDKTNPFGDGGQKLCIQWKYWGEFDTHNADAEVQNDSVEVKFDLHGNAHAAARWHCAPGPSPWAQASSDVTGRPDLTATIGFQKDQQQHTEVYMTAKPNPFTVHWDFHTFWPLNKIIDAILDGLSDVLIALLSEFGFKYSRKLVTLPDKFPGTDMRFNATLKDRVSSFDQSTLAVLGDIDFPTN